MLKSHCGTTHEKVQRRLWRFRPIRTATLTNSNQNGGRGRSPKKNEKKFKKKQQRRNVNPPTVGHQLMRTPPLVLGRGFASSRRRLGAPPAVRFGFQYDLRPLFSLRFPSALLFVLVSEFSWPRTQQLLLRRWNRPPQVPPPD